MELMLSKQFELKEEDFNYIVKVVKERLGIVLGQHKRDMVYRRLYKRINELKLSSFKDYCDYLKTNAEEIYDLANAITTNLTSFFREKHHFDHLEEHLTQIIPERRSIRIWSAGCSNGCEPYSIAMVVYKVLSKLNKRNYDIKILATDIDTNMLNFGNRGRYEVEWGEKVPEEFKKNFDVDNEYITVKDNIKSYVMFKRLNFLEKWPIKSKVDIIFCRNVIIYFDKQTQAQIFEGFANLLVDNAVIYIGHSENLNKVSDRFMPIGRTIYRKIK
jgi:chemotaxis protein methyltransferase CheR